MIERITNSGQLYAIIVRADYSEAGIHFLTPDDFSQQLAYMHHPAGKVIQAHTHNQVCREVQVTQEVLFIRQGKIRVDFYGEDRDYLGSRVLATGDVILLATGGHGFEMLEPTEMIEVKQGPYVGDADKTRLEGIQERKNAEE